MKLVLKNNESFVNKRLSIVKKEVPCLDSAWHYHPEYELLYISKSSGIRFVGDNVSHFSQGELVLVGAYLPHLYRNDPAYYEEGGNLKVNTIVMKFLKNFMGEGTFDNPEFTGVNKLLEESKYGVLFGKDVSRQLHDEILEISELSPGEQSIRMLDFLYRLSQVDDKKQLSSTDMRQFSNESPDRLDTVVKYISDNYMNTISLGDIADIACMTTNSFCRFFKKMTNKSFTEFLNEIRIRNAARMLVQENYPISEICFLVGYKSIPNFNKQFKQIMEVTPKAYRYQL